MLILNEESVKEFIKGERVLVKVWAKNCPYCDRLDTALEGVNLNGFDCGALEVSHPLDKANYKPSEFKRTYMKQDKSDEVRDSVPALFVFEKGELKHRHFGALYADQLSEWLATGNVVPSKIQQQEKAEAERKQKLYAAFAQRGELTYNLDILSARLAEVNKQIVELTNGGK